MAFSLRVKGHTPPPTPDVTSPRPSPKPTPAPNKKPGTHDTDSRHALLRHVSRRRANLMARQTPR